MVVNFQIILRRIVFLSLTATLFACDALTNSKPIANAGVDFEVMVNTPVDLDANRSIDRDGDVLTFRWRIIEQPAASGAKLENDSKQIARITPDSVGEYHVELIAYDGKAYSEPDVVVIRAKSNDVPGVDFSGVPHVFQTSERGDKVTISVVLRSMPTSDVEIQFNSSDVNEGVVKPETVKFDSSNWNKAQDVTITGVDDKVKDGPKTYKIITTVTSNDISYANSDVADFEVTNIDDESPAIIMSKNNVVIDESGSSDSVTFTLTTQPTAPIVLTFTSSDLNEAVVEPASIQFGTADWQQEKSIQIKGVDDSIVDGYRAFSISVKIDTSDTDYKVIAVSPITGVNHDNEVAAGFSISSISGATTEAGGNATFTIKLDTQPLANVSIAVASSATTEGTALPKNIVFTSVNWNLPQTVTVTGVDDAVDDGDIGYLIFLGPVVSTDTYYAVLDPIDVSVTNIDDDTAGIDVSTISGNTSESGDTATFSVKLTSQPKAGTSVTIGISSNDTSEGTVTPSTITFTTSNWMTAQIITVTGVDDAIVDGEVSYTIVLAQAVSNDPKYDKLNPQDVIVTNTDNDSTPAQFGLDSRPNNASCFAPNRPVDNTNVIALERVFTNLSFTFPTGMVQEPDKANGDWYVIEKGGVTSGPVKPLVSRINAAGTTKTILLDMDSRVDHYEYDKIVNGTYQNGTQDYQEAGLLGIALHPSFNAAVNPRKELYLNYTTFPFRASCPAVNGDCFSPYRTVVTKVTSTDGGATFILANEQEIFSAAQPQHNHNGGNIAFGPDGYLYIGMGDGGGGGDPDGNGQNRRNVLGDMLRIDVSGMTTPYGIPPDNPYVGNALCNNQTQNATANCPEIYAYGLRNPWRWSFDRGTGQLWAGDVGQDAYEEIDIITKGANYGWNIKEATHCFSPSTGCSSTGLTDPVHEYGQSLNGGGRSTITGGFVYRGNAIPELIGHYIFGDFITGRIWDFYYDNQGQPVSRLLLNSGWNISSFAQGNDGELYVVSYVNGQFYKIVAPTPPPQTSFPLKLSQTGCMDPNDTTKPGSMLIPYDVNMQLWTDGAVKQRWLALPNNTTIAIAADKNRWSFPEGTVFVKHFSINGTLAETRLLVRHYDGPGVDDGEWAGYSYEWDANGKDATLVSSVGKSKDVGSGQIWTYPSRTQCLSCHTVVSGRAVGPETLQLNRDYTYVATGRTANQLSTFEHINLFSQNLPDTPLNLPRLARIDELTATPQDRARSYFHANCAYCHQPGGPGGGPANFLYLAPVTQMGVCNATPTNDFGISGAKLVLPKDPTKSIVSYRLHTLGVGRMPPIGTRIVHHEGTALIDEWITALQNCP